MIKVIIGQNTDNLKTYLDIVEEEDKEGIIHAFPEAYKSPNEVNKWYSEFMNQYDESKEYYIATHSILIYAYFNLSMKAYSIINSEPFISKNYTKNQKDDIIKRLSDISKGFVNPSLIDMFVLNDMTLELKLIPKYDNLILDDCNLVNSAPSELNLFFDKLLDIEDEIVLGEC